MGRRVRVDDAVRSAGSAEPVLAPPDHRDREAEEAEDRRAERRPRVGGLARDRIRC